MSYGIAFHKDISYHFSGGLVIRSLVCGVGPNNSSEDSSGPMENPQFCTFLYDGCWLHKAIETV